MKAFLALALAVVGAAAALVGTRTPGTDAIDIRATASLQPVPRLGSAPGAPAAWGPVTENPVEGGAPDERRPPASRPLARAQTTRGAGAPPVSRIAFTTIDRDQGVPVVHTIRPDGTGRRAVTRGFSPRWSPDGSRLAVLDGPLQLPQLVVVESDGSGRRQLVRDSLVADAEWSPTGGEIAFTAVRPTGTPSMTYSPLMPMVPGFEGDIAVVNSVGTPVVRPVTVGPHNDASPSWSPAGDRLAFVRHNLTPGVFVTDRVGASLRPVWGPKMYLNDLSWAPGTRIAIGAEHGVFTVSPDGSVNAVERRGGAAEPQWSPDGTALLYQRYDGHPGVVAITADGRQLFSRHGHSAVWSPDGRHVVLCDDRGLVRVNRDGSRAVRVLEQQWRCAGLWDDLSWGPPPAGSG